MPLKYTFLVFFEKSLKPKNAYLGAFSDKKGKNDYGFGEKMKSLLYKSILFFLGDSEKELGAHFFGGCYPFGPISSHLDDPNYYFNQLLSILQIYIRTFLLKFISTPIFEFSNTPYCTVTPISWAVTHFAQTILG